MEKPVALAPTPQKPVVDPLKPVGMGTRHGQRSVEGNGLRLKHGIGCGTYRNMHNA